MKTHVLEPKEISSRVLYTEDMASVETAMSVASLAEELKAGENIREPVFAVRFAEFPRKFALFNGNRRTKACELAGSSALRMLEVESPRDFQVAQRAQPTSWHVVDMEKVLRYNGEYFFVDLNHLRREGLLCSAYHRARRRIREAVHKFYSYLRRD